MEYGKLGSFTTTGLVSMTKTSGVATFTGSISGAGLTINGTGGTLSLGTGLTHSFSGTWTRTNGTLDGGSSIVNFTASGTLFSGTGGTFTPNAGTVAYSLGGNQTAPPLTYNNLTLSGSGAKTFATTPTVNGVLSMEGTATVTVSSGLVTYGTSGTLQYNTATARTAGAEWITPFVASGGVLITNTGAINPGGNKILNATAPLTLNSGSSLNMSTYLLTLNGNLVNNGALSILGSGGLTLAGTAPQSIGAFTTTGAVTMSKTGGNATLTGNLAGGALTIAGDGGTLDLGIASLSHTFTGDVTLTAGTLNGDAATLNDNSVSPTAWNGTASLFMPESGTVVFGAAGNQTITSATPTFNNLTLGGTGTKTFSSSIIVNGAVSINPLNTAGGALLSLTTNSTSNALRLGGAVSSPATGPWGSSGSGASYHNDNYFLSTAPGILNVGNVLLPGTWVGTTDTNWNNPNNWNSGGVPTSSTNVTILATAPNQPAIADTIPAPSCLNILINSGATLSFTSPGGGRNTLTVYGNWTNSTASGTGFNAFNGKVIFKGAAQTINGINTFNKLTLAGTGAVSFNGTTTTVNDTLSVENGTNVNIFSGTIGYGPNATLQYNAGSSARTVSSEWPASQALNTLGGGVVIKGTGVITANGPKVFTSTGTNLSLTSGASLAMGTNLLTLTGNLLNNGATTSGSGGLTITGTASGQSIGAFTTSGTVTMSKTAGAATLTGNLNGGALTISGSGGTLNLDGGVTGLNHTFSGTVTLNAGTLNGGLSTLNENATSTTAWTGTGTLFNAGTGTVIFGGGAQTLVTPSTFYNLTLGGSGIKTFSGVPTVSNVLSMEGTASVSAAPVYGPGAKLQYNKPAAFTVGPEWLTTFAATGGVYITNVGVITLNEAKQLGSNTNVPLNINSGATLSTSGTNYGLTLHGDFIIGATGTLSAGSSNITIAGTTLLQNIGSFTTTGNGTTTGLVLMTKTAGTAILKGNIGGTGFTMNGPGGTLDLGAGLTHTISGPWIRTAGILLGNTSTLKIQFHLCFLLKWLSRRFWSPIQGEHLHLLPVW